MTTSISSLIYAYYCEKHNFVEKQLTPKTTSLGIFWVRSRERFLDPPMPPPL